jgi:hypothetical protein
MDGGRKRPILVSFAIGFAKESGPPRFRLFFASIVERAFTRQQGWQWATDVFRDDVKRAEDRGLVVDFEPLAPVETNFVNTAEEGPAIRGAIREPRHEHHPRRGRRGHRDAQP